VRLWREPPETGGAWRCEGERIQNGELVTVESLDAALELIDQAVGDDRPPGPHPHESTAELTDSEGAPQ